MVVLASNVFLQLVFLGGGKASGSTLLDTETDQKIVGVAPDWASSSLVVRLQLQVSFCNLCFFEVERDNLAGAL